MQRKKQQKNKTHTHLWDLALNCPESNNSKEQVKKYPMMPCLCPSYSQALWMRGRHHSPIKFQVIIMHNSSTICVENTGGAARTGPRLSCWQWISCPVIVFDGKDEKCHCLPSVLLRIGMLGLTEVSNIFIYCGVSQNDCWILSSLDWKTVCWLQQNVC